MKTKSLVGAALSILSTNLVMAANHELYMQLRSAHRAAYYQQQDAMMIQRETQRAYSTQKRREAKAADLAAREADRVHPARRFGDVPEHREGLPKAQMQRLADQFNRDHPDIKLGRGGR